MENINTDVRVKRVECTVISCTLRFSVTHVFFVVLEYVFQFVYIYVHFSVTSITLEIKTRDQFKH